MTAYSEKLAIKVAQNEALVQPFHLTVKNEAGADVPFNLTGAVFVAQVRTKRSTTSQLIATLTPVITNVTNGDIELRLTEAQVKAIPPGNYYYDILVRIGGGTTDNLWAAPFIVEQGISVWPTT